MGKTTQIPLDPAFPNSRMDNYKKSSEATILYNCIPWAAGENHRWWEPVRFKFWPHGAKYDTTKEALIDAFEKMGYIVCDNEYLEAGFQKVALYTVDDINYTHAARLELNGIWKSKLGSNIDIDHTIEALKDGFYGNIYKFMKKKI